MAPSKALVKIYRKLLRQAKHLDELRKPLELPWGEYSMSAAGQGRSAEPAAAAAVAVVRSGGTSEATS